MKDTKDCVLVIVTKNNKFLTVQRSKTDKWMPLSWSLPGGHIGEGESPYRAAKRELKEETSLSANTLVFLTIKHSKDNNKLHLYKCDDFDGDVQLNFEHSDYKWVTIDEIDDLKHTPKIKEYVAIAMKIPLGYY